MIDNGAKIYAPDYVFNDGDDNGALTSNNDVTSRETSSKDVTSLESDSNDFVFHGAPNESGNEVLAGKLSSSSLSPIENGGHDNETEGITSATVVPSDKNSKKPKKKVK